MATITITKVHCIRKQDVVGDDEPVIDLGGQRAWEGKIGKGDWEYPDETRTFGPSILVELKEKNGKSEKRLGSWTVNDVAVANKKVTASSSGFHYELFYDVT